MEEDAKARFKLKFYGLTIELNIIVLLVAMSIAIFFIIHSPYTLPAVIVMLILALVFSVDFEFHGVVSPAISIMISLRLNMGSVHGGS